MNGGLKTVSDGDVGFDDEFRAIPLSTRGTGNVLAVGGESKSAVCFLLGRNAMLSSPIGSLTCPSNYRDFVATIDRLCRRFNFEPDIIAHDRHPLYLSTGYALAAGLPTLAVQHHHAHLAAAAAECQVEGAAIGVCCDGLGYGTDDSAWGCEVMRFDNEGFARCETLDPFPLFGGDASALQTWRPAASLLRQAFGTDWRSQFRRVRRFSNGKNSGPTEEDLRTADRLMDRGIATVMTSSLGRVFDGVSFLLGLCEENQHEAQAAIALEHAAIEKDVAPYPFQRLARPDVSVMSVAPMIREIVQDISREISPGLIAARFHETIACMLAAAVIAQVAQRGLRVVVLAGGCFVNRRLRTRLTNVLTDNDLVVACPRRVPMGDAGLALGQAVIASAALRTLLDVKAKGGVV